MTKDEALKLALEALEKSLPRLAPYGEQDWLDSKEAITAIKEALMSGTDGAQPEQEHAQQMAKIGWQYFECPACGSEGAKAFPKPEQEPVAYGMRDTMLGKGNRMMMVRLDNGQDGCTVPLYTTPPQRKPLTDDEIILIVADCASSHQHTDIHFARAIERAHGIKELV